MDEDGKNQADNQLSIDELRIVAEHGPSGRDREAAYMELIRRYAEKGDYASLCSLGSRKDLPEAVNKAADSAIEPAAMKAIELCAETPDENSALISLIEYRFASLTTAKKIAAERIVELRLRSSQWDTLYILADNGQVQEVRDHAARRLVKHFVETSRYDSLLHYAQSGPAALQNAAKAELRAGSQVQPLAQDGTLSTGTVRSPASVKNRHDGEPRKARA